MIPWIFVVLLVFGAGAGGWSLHIRIDQYLSGRGNPKFSAYTDGELAQERRRSAASIRWNIANSCQTLNQKEIPHLRSVDREIAYREQNKPAVIESRQVVRAQEMAAFDQVLQNAMASVEMSRIKSTYGRKEIG